MITKTIVDLEILSIDGVCLKPEDRPMLTVESDPSYSTRVCILTRDGKISVNASELTLAIEKVQL